MNPPGRAALVWIICRREWHEAAGNKLLVLMTMIPPLIILATGIGAVTMAAIYPPSERDIQAIYSASPAVRGLDPSEAVQGLIATYFLVLLMLIPTVVPLTIAVHSVIGEKTGRTLEPVLATPVGIGDLLLAKCVASAVPAVIITWLSYLAYLAAVAAVGSRAAINAVTAERWLLAIVLLVPLLTLLSVNLGIFISTRVNDARSAQQIGGFIVLPVVGLAVAQVTGRVVLDEGSFVVTGALLLGLDVLAFLAARLAFQRENILARWR